MAELRLRSYAKINLALDVAGIRNDGYHEIETVMQRVSIFDDVIIQWSPLPQGQTDIKVSTTKPYIPTDERNLAYKAALLMAEQLDERKAGLLNIRINKRIPVAAGLAGGSGNGAAVIIGLNRIWNMRLNTEKLCDIAGKLGADVPFCVLIQNTRYRCALATGVGEQLTPLKKGLKKHILLAKPAFGVSTKEVFKGIDQCPIEKRPDMNELIDSMKSGQESNLYKNMINVLEEYTLNQYPEVYRLKEKICATKGVRKVLMSGSGPTVFGIYDNCSDAKKACLSMRKEGYEAYWADTVK